MGKLTDTAIRGALAPGKYGDGDGLWLVVGPTGAKSWVFRFKIEGRERSMGLGPYPTVPLAKARTEAQRHTATRAAGKDPLRQRELERHEARVEAARAKTFEEAAQEFVAAREGRWKNAKHREQWFHTLATYVYPLIGAQPVSTIDKEYVLEVLNQPVSAVIAADGREVYPGGAFWDARPDTAGRVRGRIEAVLDWARFKDYRRGDNPARWRGNLDFALKKDHKATHHPALPFDDVAPFMCDLRARPGLGALALEFLVLTVTRTNEVLGAKWAEFDELCTVWTIPAERMKAGKEHRVPLSPAACAVLARAKELKRGEFVFPAASAKRPMSNMALLALLRRMQRTTITVHGFRSTFRDWAADCTTFPSEVAEMALAHTVDDEVVAAYKRTDLFGKRRALMEAWASWCAGNEGATVHYIAGRAA
jgi:integrase